MYNTWFWRLFGASFDFHELCWCYTALIHPEFRFQTTKFPNLAYMAQNSKCGSQPDLICVASSTFQSSCKYIDLTYTPILQPLNLIDGAGGGERHSEVRKSQDLSLTGASSVMSVSPAPITRLDWMKACAQVDVHEHQSFRTSSTGVRCQCDEYHSLQGAISLTNGNIWHFSHCNCC